MSLMQLSGITMYGPLLNAGAIVCVDVYALRLGRAPSTLSFNEGIFFVGQFVS